MLKEYMMTVLIQRKRAKSKAVEQREIQQERSDKAAHNRLITRTAGDVKVEIQQKVQ